MCDRGGGGGKGRKCAQAQRKLQPIDEDLSMPIYMCACLVCIERYIARRA